MYGLGATVLTTLLLLGASTGLMHNENTGEVISADAVWGGVLAAGGPLIWAFTQISTSRPDRGYRDQGAVPMRLLTVLIASGIDLAAMCLWRPIIGDRADHGDLIAIYPADPLAFAVLALFVIGMHAAFATIVLGFVRSTPIAALLITVAFLATIGLGFWQGFSILDNPPSTVSLAVWAVAAFVALAVLALVAAVTRTRPRNLRS